jgi:4-amino-4-deoxy-L-arabinose transferase-like glycosyltransferase
LTLKGAFVKTRFVPDSNKTATRLAWLIGVTAVAVRFIAITQPFIDNWSWRESDVAAIARNFAENGFHFAYPQIDWAGNEAGYVGTEFPILPFAVALLYKIFGVHEWIGRSETVLFFAASLPFFYSLVRRICGQATALWALFFYCFTPLNIIASRDFMPDVPALSLSIAGLYFFLRWIEEQKWRQWILASVCLALSFLIKLPMAVIGAPLLYLAWRKFGAGLFKRIDLWLFAAIVLLPSAFWYWHAHKISKDFYPYHFFGAGGVKIESALWYGRILLRLATSSLTPVLFLLALAGAFVRQNGKYRHLFHWWGAAMILFVIVVGYGNRHPWYQLPLVPVGAVFAGLCCQFLMRSSVSLLVRQLAAVFVVVAFVGSAVLFAAKFYQPASADLHDLGLRLRDETPTNALLIAADDGDPTLFYYAQRKGWHFLEKNGIWNNLPLDSAEAISNLESLRKRGAAYLVLPFRTRWWLEYYPDFARHLAHTAKEIARTPEYAIYKLN